MEVFDWGENEGVEIRAANDCNDTGGLIEWKNKKFTVTVCAANVAAARAGARARIESALKKEVESALDLNCDEMTCQGDGQICKAQDVNLMSVRIRTRPHNFKNSGERGECAEGETEWTFDIRANVKAKQKCACEREA